MLWKRQKLLREIGDQKLPYLTPKDVEFQQLSKAKYSKLHLRQASCVPEEIHQKVQQGLTALRDYKCFAQDLVQIKGKDVLTPVYRLLVGNPGHTYRYLDTRLFAIPWPTHGVEVKYSSDEIGKACQAIKDLNEYFNAEAVKILLDHYSAVNKEMGFVEKTTTSTSVEGSESVKGVHYSQQNNADTALKNRTSFNVALLNYMDPSKMKYLKEEPYFGMGKMAVSWHRDENLVERSTVAVYNYSCDDLGPASDESNKNSVEGRDPALWHVGLKIAWDIATPGLALPLYPGDCYFMLDDLNMTHQHCVLSGMQSRFSSTHRVAECSSGTLDYIFGRCDVAMKNLQKDSTLGISFLTSLDLEFVRQTEEIHNEVEFEWLRQFWFQGKRSAKQSDWWFGPMAVLENSWKEMEQMTKLLLCEINKTGWSFEEKQKIIRCLLPLLEERQELRKIWTVRCQSRLANNLPIDEQPECRPYWHEGDPNMPLPFDLEEIISLLRNQLLHEDEGDKN
ncbi:alpha-ketoglutarate-dependent dioxygenase FTO isoform X2 [Pristis pectinata]|uniref:alpha-ketoglutarate-dependent dioxygenase FTO isoform X2 n=1 Tax=Pristis pectinata TaxID=685728 RepID=UPI00223D623F|nr:alpha-ketoglutarate-dependent dioxygenase FTO isoform X2 [Pristis pectinata]